MSNMEKIWIYGLRLIALVIILLGIYWFFDCRLYEQPKTNLQTYLRIFLPILVFGLSGILFGISKILSKFNDV